MVSTAMLGPSNPNQCDVRLATLACDETGIRPSGAIPSSW
jgi:hypothetical protein